MARRQPSQQRPPLALRAGGGSPPPRAHLRPPRLRSLAPPSPRARRSSGSDHRRPRRQAPRPPRLLPRSGQQPPDQRGDRPLHRRPAFPGAARRGPLEEAPPRPAPPASPPPPPTPPRLSPGPGLSRLAGAPAWAVRRVARFPPRPSHSDQL